MYLYNIFKKGPGIKCSPEQFTHPVVQHVYIEPKYFTHILSILRFQNICILYIYLNIVHMLEHLKPIESQHLTLIFSKHCMLT